MFGQNVCPSHSFGDRLHQQNKCVLSCVDQHQTMVSICQFVLPPTNADRMKSVLFTLGVFQGCLCTLDKLTTLRKAAETQIRVSQC